MATPSQNNKPAQPQQSRQLTTQETAIQRIKNPAYAKALTAVLPRGVDPERWLSIVAAEIKGPALERVNDPTSILVGVFHAAKLGLSLNKNLGEAYLVPFKDGKSGKTLAQFIPGYKGLLKLTRNAGVGDVQATVVHEKDDFTHWEDETGFHYKLIVSKEADRGEVVCVITRAKLENGTMSIHVTWLDKLTRIRNAALRKTQNSGPWQTHEDEMYAKTGIRAHCKTLPQTEELALAIRADEVASERKISADVPDELLQAGVVDAEYKEIVEQAASESAAGETKALAQEPQAKKTIAPTSGTAPALHPEKKTAPAVDPNRFHFESTVADICEAKGIDCDKILLAEFSYASIGDVAPQDFDKITKYFKEA